MAQFNWTYLGDSGRRHVVGLYHGDQSGHLVVHCNSQVIIIDFHVLESKNYTFFLDDELCTLKLERKNGQFHYGFDIDRETDTPKNRERRDIEKKHLWKGLLVAAALILFVALVFFGLRYRNQSQMVENRAVLLSNHSSETVARVTLATGKDPTRIRYSFVADGRIIEGSSAVNPAVGPNGMPLEPGDEFIIRYARREPAVHEIDFQRPSEEQIQRYRQRAFDQHARLHPQLPAARINCVLDQLFDLRGASAYADVFFQDQPPQSFPQHNRKTYEEMITDPEVSRRLGEECR